jgi:ATPase subunit of ABC transporter with duplicated ATPase domains
VGDGNHQRDALTVPRPLLAVDGLVAGYGQPVVGPVSFSLGRGEIVGLSGANGTGKTTLLNAVIGMARIFAGRVERDRAVGVSLLRQFPVRLPEMPLLGSEFLRIAGAEDGGVPQQLRPLVDRRMDRLSGGQYQLLQVWACLGSPAGLVLLDEPTNNMDPDAVAALGDVLIDARERGKGVLLISHDRSLLARVCTRVVEVAT